MSDLIGWLSDLLAWLVDEAGNLLLWLYQTLVEAIVGVVNAIPVPDWIEEHGGVAAALHPGVVFFLDMADVPTGLAIIGSAYVIRFAIRRLPFFGG